MLVGGWPEECRIDPRILSWHTAAEGAHTLPPITSPRLIPCPSQTKPSPPLFSCTRRELALQLADHFRALGSGGALRDAVIIGGVDGQAQARALTQRPHLVVATPGRLAGLLAQDPGLAACLARVRCLVLDEADRMLDASFEPELATVLAALPEERQTLLFSATMTRTLVGLQRDLLRDAFFYEAYAGLQTAARLREEYMLLPQKVGNRLGGWGSLIRVLLGGWGVPVAPCGQPGWVGVEA